MLTHKSLLAWQRARGLVLQVFQARRAHWRPWNGVLWSQLQRASLSIQLNIAEGYCSLSRRRWLHFLTIAHGSAIESLELLELMKDLEAIPPGAASELIGVAEEAVRLLHGLLKRTRAQISSP